MHHYLFKGGHGDTYKELLFVSFLFRKVSNKTKHWVFWLAPSYCLLALRPQSARIISKSKSIKKLEYASY